jgi:ureidoacrylate peracid hydrolase
LEIRPSPGARKTALLQAEPEPIEIDMQSTAIIVIDMQNAFVSKGGFFDLTGVDTSQCRKVIEPIRDICNTARAKQVKVIYVAGRYSPDLREMGNPGLPGWYKAIRFYHEHPEWRDKYVIRGTWGADIVKELEPQEGDILIEKPNYSAFFGTALDVTLQTFNIKYLVFAGVATNICVEASLRDAFYRGYFPILIWDATAPNGPQYVRDATILIVFSI